MLYQRKLQMSHTDQQCRETAQQIRNDNSIITGLPGMRDMTNVLHDYAFRGLMGR